MGIYKRHYLRSLLQRPCNFEAQTNLEMERKPCPVCLEVSLFENVSYRINPGIPVEKLGAFANSNIGICAACGTGQASPPFKSDELREFYSNLFSDASPTSRLMKRGVY